MPRTDKQNEKIRDKRRQKILCASLKLFALEGYKPVSIDNIAKESGCTHSLIYHYFASKEELYQEVLKIVKKRIYDELIVPVVNNEDSPSIILECVLRSLIEGLRGKERKLTACSLSLILNLSFYEDAITVLKLDPKYFPWTLLDTLIEKGQKVGEFVEGNPKEYSVTILGFLTGISLAAIRLNIKEIICPDADVIMRFLRKENK